jgi:hypothetical protein
MLLVRPASARKIYACVVQWRTVEWSVGTGNAQRSERKCRGSTP